MRDPLRQIKRAVSMPPGELAAKVRSKLQTRLRNRRERQRDLSQTTYALATPETAAPLARLIGEIDIALVLPHQKTIAELSGRALGHEFDLLGSGWTRVENTHGLEVTAANRAEAERIAALLPDDYTPIDWHIDFKSKQQHRWDARGWYRDQPQVVGKGVDVKMPWELSRMQHLPMLAWGYALASAPGAEHDMPASAERYRDALRSQVLDFIAHNPPRFGVNWNCAMDVGIRVAGWVLTLDLFRAAGAEFDDAFMQVFKRSVREHADHLAGNLEWDEQVRGNHYLADIAGLLIASAYLPADETTDRYLHFASRELVAETLRQFHPDGSNFEASTSYHRLSAEMVVYGLAVLQGVTKPRHDALTGDHWQGYRPGPPSPPLETVSDTVSVIPPEVIDRVARMARFTEDILDRHGRDPQIGDNDSGRFFKLLPAVMRDGHKSEGDTLREDTRNHRHLIDAVEGFFPTSRDREGADPAAWDLQAQGPLPYGRGSVEADAPALETHFIRSLLGGATFPRPDLAPFTDHIAYPGMGLYLYKHGRLATIVRCGEVGQNGHGGHAHDDQMSFVLYADGEPIVIDPGTGWYTSDIETRNYLRGATAHNVLNRDRKGTLQWRNGVAGLFAANLIGRPRVSVAEAARLICEHDAFGSHVRREFLFQPNKLAVTDHCEVPDFIHSTIVFDPGVEQDGTGALVMSAPDVVAVDIEHAGFETYMTTKNAYSSSYGALERQALTLAFTTKKPAGRALSLVFAVKDELP